MEEDAVEEKDAVEDVGMEALLGVVEELLLILVAMLVSYESCY